MDGQLKTPVSDEKYGCFIKDFQQQNCKTNKAQYIIVKLLDSDFYTQMYHNDLVVTY